MISKVKYPKGFTFEHSHSKNDGITSHFDTVKGVRFVITQDSTSREFRESNDNNPVIWFGNISMDHKRESTLKFLEWRRKCDQDFISNKEGTCYFAKVKSFLPKSRLKNPRNHWSWCSWKGQCFSVDGHHFVQVGMIGQPEKNYICVMKIDKDKTRFVWRKPLEGNYRGPNNNLIGANGRFLLMSDDMNLNIIDIMSGSLVKQIQLWEPSELVEGLGGVMKPKWSFTYMGEMHRERIIITENLLMTMLMNTGHIQAGPDALITMVNLDTFELEHKSIEAYGSSHPYLEKMHDAKMAVILPTFSKANPGSSLPWANPFLNRKTQLIYQLCHMDLTENDCDQIVAKRSMVNSRCAAQRGSAQGRRFREINKGTYLLEMSTKESGKDKTYVEVISWRIEELPRAVSKYLQIAGFNKIECDADA